MKFYSSSLHYRHHNGRVVPVDKNGNQLFSHPSYIPPPYGSTPIIIEAKPRLGKDEVNKLEREFKKNPKPSTQTKKAFAEEMKVDLPRINNWFQNRRAKRKQERKVKMGEADKVPETLSYPTPTSPDKLLHGKDHCSNNYQVASETAAHDTYKSPSEYLYNTKIMEPQNISMGSLSQSTLPLRNNSSIIHDAFFLSNNINCTSSVPLDTSSSTTSPPKSVPFECSHKYNLATLNIPHQLSSITQSTFGNFNNQIPTITSPLQEFPLKDDNIHILNPLTPTHLGGSDKISPLSPKNYFGLNEEVCNENSPGTNTTPAEDVPDEYFLKTENFNAPLYGPEFHQDTFSSPPASNNLRFISRPPVNIALRRKKVQHRPAALTANTLSNRYVTGPSTISHVDGSHFTSKSPLDSSMRKIVSAGGNRVVASGRVQKHGFDVSQRSPINIGNFENVGSMIDYNLYNIYNPPSLTGLSSMSGSLAPPTPIDVNFGQPDMVRSLTSPGEESHKILSNYNITDCLFSGEERNHQLSSDTFHSIPSSHGSYTHWPNYDDQNEESGNYKTPNESQYLDMNNAFTDRLHLSEPLSIDLIGHPDTSRYIPSYESGATYDHSLTSHETESFSCKSDDEYLLNDTTYRVEIPLNDVKYEEKIFQFSHTTPADFSEH